MKLSQQNLWTSKNKLISELDYNNAQNRIFLNEIKDIVVRTINTITKNNNQFLELNSTKWRYFSFENKVSDSPPELKCSEVNTTNKEYIEILSRMFNYFEIDEKTQEKFLTNSKKNSNKKLNDFILKKHNIDEKELEEYYAKSYMSYILTIYQESLYKIADYILLIQRTKNMTGNPQEFQQINQHKTESAGNHGKVLEFNISKTHLGHLFYNLYEIGIINKDKTDIEDKRTKLKNYINSANMFYLDNKSNHVRVEKMTRAIKVSRYIKSKEVQDEINFMESLITKLNTRLGTLKEKLENLEGRGL